MKSFLNFLKVSLVFLFSTVLVGTSYGQNSVSGHVHYSDNGQLVTAGIVKAYSAVDFSYLTSTPINPDGSFTFPSLGGIITDIIGVPNTDPEFDDFVPTYFPNATDYMQATTVLPIQQLTGIDIYVTRTAGNPGGSAHNGATISGNVTLNNRALIDAIVYAKQGDNYYGFGISDSKGNFKIGQLAAGDYILFIHRIGCSSQSINVTLSDEGLKNVNFSLEFAKKAQDNSAHSFGLSQNYPNPFNPNTKISYSIPKDGFVKLSVYNISGQLVKELVNRNQQAGNYSVDFDGSNLASGVYFYTLKSGSFVETKRLTLVK